MSQEYNVKQFQKGDFQDKHGNYWCSMVLEGVGEPVRIVVKDPMQFESGMTLYGDISEQTSKAGKQYLRFKRAERPEGEKKDKLSKEYWKQKNATIRAQWAIGQSMTWQVSRDQINWEQLESDAKRIYAMVDEVAGSNQEQEETVAKEVADSIDDGTPINLDDIPF